MSNNERDTDPQIESINNHALEYLDRAVAMRRRLHEWPELGLELPRTRDEVLASIEDLPLDVTLHSSTSGVTATLEGTRPGPTILLRGDMDALPMPEDTEVEFQSKVDGCMHACGHDTHTAMLSTAARVLSERRDEIAGRVLFMFQPGEEGHHGAQHMLDEGLLDVPAFSDGSESPVDAAFAIHMTSSMPTGWVATRRGAVMAAADTMRVIVTGKGGHASEPYRAVDPIPVACEIVTALNVMITRSINPFDPAVLTISQIHAGTVNNVIPETAFIEGTIRAVSAQSQKKVHDGIKRIAENIAAAHDCGAEVRIDIGYPVTSNNDRFADFSLDLAREVAPAAVEMPSPAMGSEDFSYVLDERPGAMVFLGATPPGMNLSTVAPNHSNRVHFDEQAMATGIALYSATALRHLAPA